MNVMPVIIKINVRSFRVYPLDRAIGSTKDFESTSIRLGVLLSSSNENIYLQDLKHIPLLAS